MGIAIAPPDIYSEKKNVPLSSTALLVGNYGSISAESVKGA